MRDSDPLMPQFEVEPITLVGCGLRVLIVAVIVSAFFWFAVLFVLPYS
jgi:hypothetical protein